MNREIISMFARWTAGMTQTEWFLVLAFVAIVLFWLWAWRINHAMKARRIDLTIADPGGPPDFYSRGRTEPTVIAYVIRRPGWTADNYAEELLAQLRPIVPQKKMKLRSIEERRWIWRPAGMGYWLIDRYMPLTPPPSAYRG